MERIIERTKRQAFTLIELLVVIAIIALLAAILFPVFSKAREKARQTTCASNEKQIGLAMLQYVQDYDDTLGYRTTPVGTWKKLFMPYIKSTGVLICPSNTSNTLTDADALPVSYVVNTVDNSPLLTNIGVFSTGTFPPVTSAQVTTPSTTIAVLETTWTNSDFVITNGYYDGANGPNGSNADLFVGHTSMSNYLFVDGHVKAMTPFGTLSQPQGGTGPINAWDRTGADFTTGGNVTTAHAILANAVAAAR